MLKQLILVLSLGVLGVAHATTPVKQVTHGWCSPAIANVEGDVTINCQGVDPKIVARLNEVNDIKDKQLSEAVRLANEWIVRYQELEVRLSQTEDPTEQEKLASELLKEGHLEDAGRLLDELLEKEDEALKRIANTHFNRAKVYSLLLYSTKAIPHYRKAHELVPENLEYTLELAKVLQTQSQNAKAYELYKEILQATNNADANIDSQQLLFRAEALQGVAKAYIQAQGDRERYKEAVRYDEAAVAVYRKLNKLTSGQYTFNLATAIQQLISSIQARDFLKSAGDNLLVYEATALFEKLAKENPEKEAYYLAYAMGTMLQLFIAQQINAMDISKEPEAMDRILAMHERIRKTSAQYITVEVAGSYTIVSLAYFLRQKYADSEEAATQAIDIIEKYTKFGDEYYKALPLLYYFRSMSQKIMHNYKEATISAKSAVDIAKKYAERNLIQTGPMLQQFFDNLVEMQRMTGQTQAASETLAESRRLSEELAAITKHELTYESKQKPQQNEQIHAYHILIDNEAKAKEIIKGLQQSKDVEKDFQAYAKQYSIDPSSSSGGDLGWFKRDDMVKSFEDAAFSLDTREVSRTPVKTQFGWHVIYVKEKE